MKIIIHVIGVLVMLSGVGWPMAHCTHKCPPIEEWKDSICPQAQVMELCFFLQIIVGFFLVSIGK